MSELRTDVQKRKLTKTQIEYIWIFSTGAIIFAVYIYWFSGYVDNCCYSEYCRKLYSSMYTYSIQKLHITSNKTMYMNCLLTCEEYTEIKNISDFDCGSICTDERGYCHPGRNA
jgi:uncharacterized membrane protein